LAPLLLAPDEAVEGALEELLHPAPIRVPRNITGNATCIENLFMDRLLAAVTRLLAAFRRVTSRNGRTMQRSEGS
jgi:hypothetical protein